MLIDAIVIIPTDDGADIHIHSSGGARSHHVSADATDAPADQVHKGLFMFMNGLGYHEVKGDDSNA